MQSADACPDRAFSGQLSIRDSQSETPSVREARICLSICYVRLMCSAQE